MEEHHRFSLWISLLRIMQPGSLHQDSIDLRSYPSRSPVPAVQEIRIADTGIDAHDNRYRRNHPINPPSS